MFLCGAVWLLALLVGCMGGRGIKFEIQPGDDSAQRLRELSEAGQADHLAARDLPEINADEYERFGDALLSRGQNFQAYVQYEKSLKLKPDNRRAAYKMGLSLLLGGKPDDAIEQFKTVVKNDSAFAYAYEGLGWAYFEKKDYQQAETQFKQAVELNHRLWRSYNFLGNIYDYRREYDQAALEYISAISAAPDHGQLYNNLGVSYTRAGKNREAVEAFGKAIGRNCRDPRVFNNLGLALANLGRYDEALDAFKKGGNEARAYNNMGCIYLDKGEYVEAVRCFEKAIALGPEFYAAAAENLKKAKMLAAKQ
jgi:Flp pilus assembly protein TadD